MGKKLKRAAIPTIYNTVLCSRCTAQSFAGPGTSWLQFCSWDRRQRPAPRAEGCICLETEGHNWSQTDDRKLTEVRYSTLQYGEDNSRPIPEILKPRFFTSNMYLSVPIKQRLGKKLKRAAIPTIYNTVLCSRCTAKSFAGPGTCWLQFCKDNCTSTRYRTFCTATPVTQ